MYLQINVIRLIFMRNVVPIIPFTLNLSIYFDKLLIPRRIYTELTSIGNNMTP